MRSRKDLESTRLATSFQREFAKTLQTRVVQNREPFAIAQADTAHEIFHTLDIPVIANQWWSAYLSAKQLAGHYFQVLQDHGFPANSCRYCTLGLGCTLDDDPARAPWGGLPRPTVIAARATCDCIQRVFSHWARALNTRCYLFEAPGWTHKDPRWFEKSRDQWDEVFEPQRIDLHVAEMRGLIELLEAETGRRFDMDKLIALMERINEQESLMYEAALLIGAARPCPVSVVDQIPNVMIPQWHRGSPWAVEHARRFRDEVKARIEQGAAACPDERIRLMWIGAGLWHDAGFYNALEERHGAVFVWSMYLAFSGPQYIRHGLSDPLRTLASRICSLNEVLHLPPWMNEWMVHEARRSGVDAAVILVPSSNRLSISGTRITKLSLEAAGIPALEIDADMVDAKGFRHGEMVDYVSEFLRTRVEGK
ncbi:MAG TPA: 2-hydroxyacyl-CoA dehydratase family protein [Polyangiales bacterium]|nr:2-hydroxyacyl-CoA dehydratase family protein [Polyangiales bacterium]